MANLVTKITGIGNKTLDNSGISTVAMLNAVVGEWVPAAKLGTGTGTSAIRATAVSVVRVMAVRVIRAKDTITEARTILRAEVMKVTITRLIMVMKKIKLLSEVAMRKRIQDTVILLRSARKNFVLTIQTDGAPVNSRDRSRIAAPVVHRADAAKAHSLHAPDSMDPKAADLLNDPKDLKADSFFTENLAALNGRQVFKAPEFPRTGSRH